MSARQHRDELIALLALVLLTAVVLGTIAIVRGGDDDDGGPATATASGAPSESGAPEDGASEDATPVVGGRPYVYPCQLLPTDDVQRLFGAFGAAGRVRQEQLTRTASAADLRDTDTLGAGGVTTHCRYTFDDSASHLLDVNVTQFGTAAALESRWSALRVGDPRSRVVPGTGDALLAIPAGRAFALRGDLMITELSYTTLGDIARGAALRPRQLARLRPRMQQAAGLVRSHLADGSATSGPRSTYLGLGSAVDGVPYVEPCSLLVDDAVTTLGVPAPAPVVADSSYVGHDNFADAQTAICERQSTERSGTQAWTTFVALEVRLAATPEAAEEMQSRHLARRYPRGTPITTMTTDAGTAYVVDVGGSAGWKWRTRAVHLVVGPYEVMLSVLSHVGPGTPWGNPVPQDRLGAAVVAAAAELPSVS